jgi:Tfp pilus assembly protein PilV
MKRSHLQSIYSEEYQRATQSGQTLVETMVASLVLVIGIGAAVGLAIYGLSATSGVTKQLIGLGLAREGVEAVKNMRDTNWLQTAYSQDCYDFTSSTDVARCYKDWLNGPPYDLDPGSSATYALGFDITKPEESYWQLIRHSSNFGLNYTPINSTIGFYSTSGSGVAVASATSDFARKITLTLDNSVPFNEAEYPRLHVRVDVWWRDKRCPLSNEPPASAGCKVTLETYLTNWKDY